MVREKVVTVQEVKVLISALEGWERPMIFVELCILLETWPCGPRTLRATETMPRWVPPCLGPLLSLAAPARRLPSLVRTPSQASVCFCSSVFLALLGSWENLSTRPDFSNHSDFFQMLSS